MRDGEFSLRQRARIFSRYGYVADPDWEVLQLFAGDDFLALKHELAKRSEAELIARAGHVARAAFEACLSDVGGEIVIPLSGGLDSRFILAMAAELGLAQRTLAMTWGGPGCLDLAIAPRLAAHYGVRHERFEICNWRLSFDDLAGVYAGGAHWTDLVRAYVNQAWRGLAPQADAVVGYLGNSTAGGRCEADGADNDFVAAVAAFEKVNVKRRAGGCMIDASARQRLMAADRISWPEQLDLVYRQHGYLRRVLAPAGANARTPLAHRHWVQFMYALPAAMRSGKRFYMLFLQQRFPAAFALGGAASYGRGMHAPAWERRLGRIALRSMHALRNVGRTHGFFGFDKYGDAHDIAAMTLDAGAPGAYARSLRRRPARAEPEDAADWHNAAMRACNLVCATRALDAAALPIPAPPLAWLRVKAAGRARARGKAAGEAAS